MYCVSVEQPGCLRWEDKWSDRQDLLIRLLTFAIVVVGIMRLFDSCEYALLVCWNIAPVVTFLEASVHIHTVHVCACRIHAFMAHLVEQWPRNLSVAGSNLIQGSSLEVSVHIHTTCKCQIHVFMAHLVEEWARNLSVAGSNLIQGSSLEVSVHIHTTCKCRIHVFMAHLVEEWAINLADADSNLIQGSSSVYYSSTVSVFCLLLLRAWMCMYMLGVLCFFALLFV